MVRHNATLGLTLLLLAIQSLPLPETSAADEPLQREVAVAMKRAAEFYHDRLAVHGGYPYYSSLDLAERWGEGKIASDTIVIQPPGTPTVGTAYLRAFAATNERFYLDAARHAAEALAAGRSPSGGWSQTATIGPNAPQPKKTISSLDDNQTQSALRFLCEVDAALEFKHVAIHEAATEGLQALLEAQFPNGAFPQVWSAPVKPQPIAKSQYPEHDWRTERRVKNYWDYYTLNDNLAGTTAETLITAHRVYRDEKYRTALMKLGDFLLLAQMPEPQPAWCQQYDYDMYPIWARKFEPPAITGSESQDALRTLIRIAAYTSNDKYLATVPRAIEYLKTCLLPSGEIARFYELRTNKPLYMDADYRLTYDDSNVPRHYGWKQPARLAEIERAYRDALARKPASHSRKRVPSADEVRSILAELDSGGRWVCVYRGDSLTGQPKFAPGFRYISSEVFASRLENLSFYLADEK